MRLGRSVVGRLIRKLAGAFARKLHGLQESAGDDLIYMDQTTFQLWAKPTRTW